MPVILDLVEIIEIELILEILWTLVVENAQAVELIVNPHTIISWLVLFIVEYAPPIHLIVLKLTFIINSVFESEFALALLFSIQFVTFIVTVLAIYFSAINKFFIAISLILELIRNLHVTSFCKFRRCTYLKVGIECTILDWHLKCIFNAGLLQRFRSIARG